MQPAETYEQHRNQGTPYLRITYVREGKRHRSCVALDLLSITWLVPETVEEGTLLDRTLREVRGSSEASEDFLHEIMEHGERK